MLDVHFLQHVMPVLLSSGLVIHWQPSALALNMKTKASISTVEWEPIMWRQVHSQLAKCQTRNILQITKTNNVQHQTDIMNPLMYYICQKLVTILRHVKILEVQTMWVNKIKWYSNALNCQALLANAIPVMVCIMTLPPQKNSFMLLRTRGHKAQHHNTTTYFRCTTCQHDFVLSQLLWSLYSLSQVSRLLYKKKSAPVHSVAIQVYLQVTQLGDCLKYIYFHQKNLWVLKNQAS